jgi:hypothetical protein
MRREQIDGAWYCDSTPDGATLVLLKNRHLLFSGTVVDLPPGNLNLLYPRLSEAVTMFAGVGHQDDQAWEWILGKWQQRGPAFGPNACIYDAAGNLNIVRGPGTITGSQGWRYLADDGHLVTCDETYADPARRIWEYTTHGDVTVGQGGDGPHGEDPCIVLIDGTRRLLEAGTCRFIRFRRHGGLCSICFVKPEGAVFIWATRAELAALPLAESAPIPGPSVPTPGTPEPPPMPDYPLPEAVYNVVLRMAKKFPALRKGDDDQRRAFTMKVAEQVRRDFGPAWGTKRADPSRPLSKDAIARKTVDDQIVSWDLINGTTREVHPSPIMGEDISDQVFVEVDPVDHLGTVPDEPPSQPQPDYAAQIADLKAQVAALLARVLDVQQTAIKASTDASLARGQVQGVLEALPQRLANLKVRGTNGRSWSHSHTWTGEIYE